MSFEHMINYLYTDPNSMLWMISIAATLGIAFTIFGQVLIHFGAGEIFVDLAMLVCGRMRGGTAKTTVVSSSLFGTISGGAVSNVLVDGFITIPMMIKSGYKPAVAAATEAVSSTGGQIMPPVMGIGAFVMAEYLGVPYAKVAIAAIIPALLYYFAVYTQLDIDAAKLGIKALSRDQIPPLARTIKHSWSFILTISLLVYTLFIKRLDASVAATITGLLSVPILVVASKNRRGCFRLFINSLEGSGRLLLTIGTVMALAGIVVGIVNISGLGFSISYLITQVGKFNIMFLLLGTAAASMILGMGMPTVAAYALAATVCATAMIKSGIDPMATHMFIFYFAVISNITPPIALAIFAAAPIAGAPIMKTGYIAMRLAIMSYIVPFLFVFSPSLLLKGPLVHIVISVVTATVGVYFLCVALTGFLIQGISWLRRIVIGVGALALLLPTRQDIFTLTVVINAVGLLILFITIQPEIRFLFTKSRPNPNKLATLDQKELTEPK
jgi:TRAP transporter 4TM/12TM fusion protein